MTKDGDRPKSLAGAGSGKPKLADVARVAGVSPATVSRVLSSPDLVRAETRRTVLDAVRALGYVADGAARALASGRTRTIGSVVPTLSGAIFARSTHALQMRLFEAGYHLLVASHNYDPQLETELTRTLIERGVDALVLVGLDHAPELLQIVENAGVPLLLTWVLDRKSRHPCIGFDNRRAAARAARHLLDLGHTRFSVISGQTHHNDRARDRIQGVREELQAAGIVLDEGCVVEEAFTLDGGREGLRRILGLSPRPSAVLCGNDVLAAGALLEAQAQGLSVPDDLSICGFDDSELAAQLPPGLTTMRVPQEELGQRAAEHLIRRLAGGLPVTSEELAVDLILRGSTGPALLAQRRARRRRRGS